MLRKLLTISLMLSVSSLTQFSCQRENQGLVSPHQGAVQDLSIEEARSYMTRQHASARVNAQSMNKRNEYWNDAQKMAYKNGLPVVVVPLTYNYSPQLVINGKHPDSGKPFDRSDYAIQKKLFVYKDNKGNMQVDVIFIIPTEEDRRKHKHIKGDDFDGYVLAYDNTETVFRGGWFYKAGKAKNRVRIQATRTARTSATLLNDSPCSLLIYGDNSGGTMAGRTTTSSTSDPSTYPQFPGYQLSSVVPIDCGDGGGGSEPPPAWAPNDPSFGDVDWLWNTQAPSPSGGGGGSTGFPPPPPYEPFMVTENGVSGGSPEENFFYDMEYNQSPSIFFTEAEKALTTEFPGFMYSLKNYILETGQKPDLSMYLLANNASIQQFENASAVLLEEGNEQTLSKREQDLLGLGTPAYAANLKKFYSDARRATIMADINYGYHEAVTRGASKANAFKHSLLAILHAVNFTRAMGVALANAHEGDSQTVDSRMDRWNNDVGFQLYDQQPNVSLLVYSIMVSDAVFNGEMMYVKTDGDQFLTPTNQ